MRNHALNRYKHARREKRIPPEDLEPLSELEDFLSAPAESDMEEDAKVIGSCISQYLRRVTTRKRYIFISRYFSLSPIAEIADALSVSTSTVKKELLAIRKPLFRQLAKLMTISCRNL